MTTKQLAVGIVLVLILVGVLSAFKVFGRPLEALSVSVPEIGGCDGICRTDTAFCKRNITGTGKWKPYNPKDTVCHPISNCFSSCAASGSPYGLGWLPIEFTDGQGQYTTNGITITKQPRQGSKFD